MGGDDIVSCPIWSVSVLEVLHLTEGADIHFAVENKNSERPSFRSPMPIVQASGMHRYLNTAAAGHSGQGKPSSQRMLLFPHRTTDDDRSSIETML